MALIPINIGVHIFELYNLALAIMIISIVFILISIRQIFVVFIGTRDIQNQIAFYLDYCFRVRDKYSQKDIDFMMKLLDKFLEDGCEIIGKQSNIEF